MEQGLHKMPGWTTDLKNAGSLRVCFRRLILSYRHYFQSEMAQTSKIWDCFPVFSPRRLVLKTRNGSVFKSRQPAYPLPVLLSVNPVLRADFIKRRKDFEMAVQVFKNSRGFSAEFAVQI